MILPTTRKGTSHDQITYRYVSDSIYLLRSTIISAITSRITFPSESEKTRIISGLKWIGLFSNDAAVIKSNNLLDTLCARLEQLMQYEKGERDLIMLQHKFIVEWKDGSRVRSDTSSLVPFFLISLP